MKALAKAVGELEAAKCMAEKTEEDEEDDESDTCWRSSKSH